MLHRIIQYRRVLRDYCVQSFQNGYAGWLLYENESKECVSRTRRLDEKKSSNKPMERVEITENKVRKQI
ncbi:hypothetical protein [Paenibacillus sp. IHBB 10380]|uniref:hypothetical protein n=1 Tax=Paenibacillus sp. IHBB 10380 TaxID=1566358 RepID=UPI0005CFB796|nr:hypothetical protein [Paenibacillus sp. IHBB 10380]AJS57434.1 hypothetical protein UB51_01795 [Paenibacillus sp. IHBB 10380]